MAFAPYSPILFGVNKDAVKEHKLCSSAILKVTFLVTDTNFCHFKISKNQLKELKNNKKTMVFNENI